MNTHTGKKSKIPFIVLTLICIFVLLGLSFWVALKRGISLNHINIASIKVEQVSIKADKGLVILIDRLDIPSGRASNTLSDPEQYISHFNRWAHLFREIRINKIIHRGNAYQFLFNDNLFTVSGTNFKLVSSVNYKKEDDEVQLDITKFEVKPYPVSFSGKVIFSREEKSIAFNGKFTGPDIAGKLSVSYLKDHLNAEVNTEQFSDLGKILKQFPLDEELTDWISENISASNYRIDELKASIPFQDGKPDIRPENITGKAVATDAEITFHPSLEPVEAEKIHISYNNDRLSFKLDEPKYKSKNLEGSNVRIDNLVLGTSQMDINIQTQSQFDNVIHEILQAYDITIPFTQNTGTTKADLHLLFDLPEFTLHTDGTFTTSEGSWNTGDISFQTSGAAVQLKDELVIFDNASITHEITYQEIFKEKFHADLTGSVDTKAGQAMLRANIERLELLEEKREIIKIHDLLHAPINIDFSGNELIIHLPFLGVVTSLSPSHEIVYIKDLKKLKPYMPALQHFPFQSGQLSIDLTDRDNLLFDGSINTSALPLSLNGKQETKFSLQGKKTKDTFIISINEGKISLTVTDKLKVDLKDYLVIIDTEKIGKNAGPPPQIPILISGPRSLIKSKTVSIPTREFRAELSGSDVTFSADLNQGHFLFESKGKEISFTATDINAFIVQDYFEAADLKGGRFNLQIKIQDKNNFEGIVEFSDVLIKDLALMNNVLAFFNAIPALATLTSPGFDNDGYRIDDGVVKFALSKGVLTLQQIRTDGQTIDIEAEGWVDINQDKLEIKAELISMKDYSKIISKIPLAGYALLGADGSLSTTIDMTGKYSDPDITTHVTQDILMTPVNIIRRTIQWPFKVVDDMISDDPDDQKETGQTDSSGSN